MLCDQTTKWNHHIYAWLFKVPKFQCSARTFHLFIYLMSVSHIKLHIVYNWAKRMHNIQKKSALNFKQKMTVRWTICHYNISTKVVPNLKDQTLKKNKRHLKSWVLCFLRTFRANLAMVLCWHTKQLSSKLSGNEINPTRGSRYHLSRADQTQRLNRRQKSTNWFENKKSWGPEIAVTNYVS